VLEEDIYWPLLFQIEQVTKDHINMANGASLARNAFLVMRILKVVPLSSLDMTFF